MNSKDAKRIYEAIEPDARSLFNKNASYKKKLLNALKKMDYPVNPFSPTAELAKAVRAEFAKINPNWEESSDELKEVINTILEK